jgi:hypothetical protein
MLISCMRHIVSHSGIRMALLGCSAAASTPYK